MTPLEHLAQDLRAHAHEVPDRIGTLMRQAAVVCDDHAAMRFSASDTVLPPPIPPPPIDRKVKGAPCN
jgi:hypothetical protein